MKTENMLIAVFERHSQDEDGIRIDAAEMVVGHFIHLTPPNAPADKPIQPIVTTHGPTQPTTYMRSKLNHEYIVTFFIDFIFLV